MASNSKSTTLSSTVGNKMSLTASFNETATSTDGNYSTVSCTASAIMTSGTFSQSSATYLVISWHNNVNNTTTELGRIQVPSLTRSSATTVSGSMNSPHASDGTGSGYAIATWINTGTNGYVPVAGSVQTDSTALTDIPRASKPTATDGYIGGNITINTNRRSNDFTHTLKYTFGSLTNQQIATGVTDTIQFSLPSSFYAQIPNDKEGTMTISCDTFKNGTQIGTTQTTTCKVMCAENECKPDYTTSVALTDGTATTSLTGSSSILIANYSTAQLQWTATAKNSATISGVMINGIEGLKTTSPINLDFVNNWSSYTSGVVSTCYDSRTFTRTNTNAITIKEWFTPTATLSVRRTTPTGSEVKASFSGSFWNSNFGSQANTLTLSWKYREKGTSNWTTGGNLTANTHYKVSGNNFYSGTGSSPSEITLSSSAFPYNKAYDIALFYKDKIVDTFIYETVPKGKPIFWWDENGIYDGDDNKYLTGNRIYPIGSSFYSKYGTDPATTLGFGTWTERDCHEEVENGTITATGVDMCRYRIFADGTFELEAVTSVYNMNSGTSHKVQVAFPYTVTSAVCVCSLHTGGSNFPNTNCYSNISSDVLTIYRWNFGGGTASSLQDSVIVKGTLDLASNNIDTIHRFERTA